jgi:hypothetical protein
MDEYDIDNDIGYYILPETEEIDPDYDGYYIDDENQNLKYRLKENAVATTSKFLGNMDTHRVSHNGICGESNTDIINNNFFCTGKNKNNPKYNKRCNPVTHFDKSVSDCVEKNRPVLPPQMLGDHDESKCLSQSKMMVKFGRPLVTDNDCCTNRDREVAGCRAGYAFEDGEVGCGNNPNAVMTVCRKIPGTCETDEESGVALTLGQKITCKGEETTAKAAEEAQLIEKCVSDIRNKEKSSLIELPNTPKHIDEFYELNYYIEPSKNDNGELLESNGYYHSHKHIHEDP